MYAFMFADIPANDEIFISFENLTKRTKINAQLVNLHAQVS